MALKLDFQVNGFNALNGYVRVQDLFCTKNLVDIGVAFKASDADLPIKIQKYSFVPNMDGGNFIKQAYEHLKTLPEFAGATDC